MSFAKPSPVGRVGRYEMGAEIASGGMATVYLARMSGAAGFEKFVALKRVHPHLASEPAFLEMFLDEARIAARIEHPNVCQVFDFGEAEGAYYIAMEFLVGETLAGFQRALVRPDHLQHPRRSFVCSQLLTDACEGLHAAHELRNREGELLNVVHRDISPQNLFVTLDGNTKVVDFGIASASDRLHQTMDGKVKGKFAYMAPEQARGMKVDRRADVFALGVVLWELLAVQRLFRRDTPAETLVALMSDPIVPPSQRSRLAPPELDPVVMRALSRDPAERYATARELGRDLLRTLNRIGDPVDRAEVAEWMQALFPEARRRHEILLENARWLQAEPTERSDPSSVSGVSRKTSSSWSGVDDASDPADVREVSDVAAPVVVVPVAAPPPPSPAFPPVTSSPASVTGAQEVRTPTRGLPWRLIGPVLGVLVGFGAAGLAVSTWGVRSPLEGAEALSSAGGAASSIEVSEIAQPGSLAPGTPEAPDAPSAGADRPDEDTDPPPSEAAFAPVEEPEALNEAEGPGPATSPRAPRGARAARPSRPSVSAVAATPAPSPAGSGTVIVSTPGGWANVYDANGRFLGDTPLTVSLPEGRHRLSLRPFGQPPSRNATVEVRTGETARVNQPL